MPLLRIACALLCFASVTTTVAQELFFENISVKNGLSQNTVRCMEQDRKGFIWIGTEDGLNRFDGISFRIFRHDEDDSTTIADDYIIDLFLDASGRLWALGYNTISLYNEAGNNFQRFYISSKSGNATQLIAQDGRGRLWVGGRNGLYLFEPEKNKFTEVLANTGIRELLPWQDRMYVITLANIFRTGLAPTAKPEPVGSAFLQRDSLLYQHGSAVIDETGDLWMVNSRNGLTCVNPETGKYNVYDPPTVEKPATEISEIRCLQHDSRRKTIWMGTYDGLIRFSKTDKTFSRIKENIFRPGSLSNNHLFSLFIDQAGLLWVGTNGSGVDKLNVYRGRFSHYTYSPMLPGSLTSPYVLSFCEPDSVHILVGTDGGGMNIFDRKKNLVSSTADYTFTKNSPRFKSIFSLACTPDGNTWLGTEAGLFRADMKQKKFEHFHFSNYKNDKYLRVVIADPCGNLWLGSASGLVCIDLHRNQTKTYTADKSDTNGLTDNNVRCLYFDRSGKLWVGTASGLHTLNPQNGKWTNETRLLSDKPLTIQCIEEDNNGTIWVANPLKGLIGIDVATRTTKRFNTRNGLPNNFIYGVLTDRKNRLWISCNQGICCYDQKIGTFQGFDVRDGLQSMEFNGGSYFRSKNGTFFYGGINGFNVFNPDKIILNKYQPKIAITSARLFDQEMDIAKGVLELNHRQNYLSFEFASFDYTAPEKNKLRYKLEGVNEEWTDAGNRHFVSYATLEPGTYIFKVQGSNSDGIWSPAQDQLIIHIKPPVWRTWPFIIITVAAALLLLVWIILKRIRHVEHKYELNKQIAELEMKALRSQMNPHFIFNALNSIQDFILSNEPREAAKYLNKFSKLIRDILDFSESPAIPIHRKIRFLQLYLEIENLRFGGELHCSVTCDESIDQGNWKVPTMLIQPYVENALWHGLKTKQGEKQVTISFRLLSEQLLEVIVEDNGIGRARAQKLKDSAGTGTHESMSMRISEERVELLRQTTQAPVQREVIDLYDGKNEPAGTKVILHIPYFTH